MIIFTNFFESTKWKLKFDTDWQNYDFCGLQTIFHPLGMVSDPGAYFQLGIFKIFETTLFQFGPKWSIFS